MSVIGLLRQARLPVRARNALARVRARIVFRGHPIAHGVGADGPVELSIRGALALGRYVHFMAGTVATRLEVGSGGSLSIGERSHFNYGVSISAHERITIGERCLFGSFVRLHDTEGGRVAPISVGDRVWVAHGAVIGPGVTLGDGAVVAAGSHVECDVPAGKMAIGRPARVVSQAMAQNR